MLGLRVRRLAGRNSHLCSGGLFHYACRMKITNVVREYAVEQGVSEEMALNKELTNSLLM